MDKKAAFRQLAEDVSRCHLCARLKMPPHSSNGECLINDNHGLNTDMPYVNLWNLWHYDLDADVMIIGQDYGQREDTITFPYDQTLTDTTSKNLKELCTVFDANISFFFTNAANCYRKNKTSGGMHDGWLPICANKFLGRLIRIIQPKAIIVLGERAFTALSCLEDIPLVCHNAQSNVEVTLAEYMQHDYYLTINNTNIAVFPVYHPGTLGQRFRSFTQQKQDWEHIAEKAKTLLNT